MRYLINTPVLTAYGSYRFSGPLALDEVQRRLDQEYTSAIGHQGTARLLTRLLGREVAANRIAIAMQPGDEAIVLKLETRLPEGAVLDAAALARIPFEFGLLERLA